MELGARVRRAVADPNASSLGANFRRRRWAKLLEVYPLLREMTVLDLGGTVNHWVRAPVRPRRVVVLNPVDEGGAAEHVEVVLGDACDPPAWLRGEKFDLVYSNSVLEHVGGPSRRAEFAQVVNDLAADHWIQTPYRYFPIEPHWIFPGFQFLPLPVRARLAAQWPLGWSQPDLATATRQVLETDLVGRCEMRLLFPDSKLIAERFAFMTKSLIAVR